MPLDILRKKLAKGEAVVAGVLSGTSADGIDVALVAPGGGGSGARGEATRAPRLLEFATEPFPRPLATELRRVLDGEPADLRRAALLHRDLGRAFGEAAASVARRAGRALDLVGSHGQTVWHHDGSEPSGPATLQLGDGDFVAEATGCAVVSDFRQRDVAAGGEGAPISALVDDELFAGLPRPAAVLNLGGMANLTWLPEPQGELLAFDVGPCGSLLDGLARRLLDRRFDRGGEVALRGTVRDAWLAELGAHPFFELPAPRSTGRDTFGEAWIDESLERADALGLAMPPGSDGAAADLLATATELVATETARCLARHVPGGCRGLWVCGGGVHNAALLGALERHCAQPVRSTVACGVDPDAREALVFALLAVRCVLEEPRTSPSATGAAAGRVLGKISPARGAP